MKDIFENETEVIKKKGYHPLVGDYTFQGTRREHLEFRLKLDREWKTSPQYVSELIVHSSQLNKKYGF